LDTATPATSAAPFANGQDNPPSSGAKVFCVIAGVSFDALLADKAFDADWLLQNLDQRGATAVIPPKGNRKICLIPGFDGAIFSEWQASPHTFR